MALDGVERNLVSEAADAYEKKYTQQQRDQFDSIVKTEDFVSKNALILQLDKQTRDVYFEYVQDLININEIFHQELIVNRATAPLGNKVAYLPQYLGPEGDVGKSDNDEEMEEAYDADSDVDFAEVGENVNYSAPKPWA